jgi:hypothetical protein
MRKCGGGGEDTVSLWTRRITEVLSDVSKHVCSRMLTYTGRITEVVSEVSKRLVDLGRFEQAAEFFEGIDAHKDAIDVYMRAGLWDKARAVTTHAPQVLTLLALLVHWCKY